MSQKSNQSAVARTVPMPGVDCREQRDMAELDLRGTPLVRIVVKDPSGEGSVRGIFTTHLSVRRFDKELRPLCKAKGDVVEHEPGKASLPAMPRAGGLQGAWQSGRSDSPMSPEQLQRWIALLEQSRTFSVGLKGAVSGSREVLTVVRELHRAWAEAVRKECA